MTAVGTGGKVYLADADLSPIALGLCAESNWFSNSDMGNRKSIQPQIKVNEN